MKISAATFLLATGLLSSGWLAGCSASSSPAACVSTFTLNAAPVNVPNGSSGGVADHAAAAPGNQQQFKAYSAVQPLSGSCAVPAIVAPVNAQWTTSDNMDIQISSAAGDTNGLATCIGATLSPATITATYTENGVTKTSSSTLTCK